MDKEISTNRGAVLAVPAHGRGMVGGHLIRCMALIRGLRALGRVSWLYLYSDADIDSLAETINFDKNWLIGENDLQDKNLECIVLDRFQTSQEELTRWTHLAPVIGIDEGGHGRDRFDFLIDILPGSREWRLGNGDKQNPNIADPSLLPLPPKKPLPSSARETSPFKILVSFGHEDAAELGSAVAFNLAKKNSECVDITLLHGKLHVPTPTIKYALPTIHFLESIPNLNEHLNNYDLIITHYGLTAYEALYASVPVLLLSPGSYHEKLAKKAGFCSLGVGKSRAVKLTRLLFKNNQLDIPFLENLKKQCAVLAVKHNLDHTPRQSLAELIDSFAPDVSRNCPVCGSMVHGPSLARFPDRTYRRCKQCGTINMNRLNPPPVEYDVEYFFESYQKQYGKTYIEDFPNLIAMGKRRLAVIKSLLPANINSADESTSPLLLDIGCAYGPFLAAAREEGFSPYGIDPAQDAVCYVTQTIGIPAVQGFFPEKGNGEWGVGSGEYSVVSLWYVIEHLRDCVPALAEIRKMLKPNGILAFATPSFSGISGRASLKHFLEHSPADHWTIWSPAVCKKALKAAGFKVKKMVITGHHPERFPLLGKYAQNTQSLLYKLLLTISKIFALGDTFEVYAVKATRT